MATFDVRVRRLNEVLPHPNADRLDLARVDGYFAVVAKGQFTAGDLVAYIPEAAVLPTVLIEELGLTGKLAGADLNRVHAVRLRGVLSQGVCMAARPGWQEGQSVREELGIVKFEPTIPAELLGRVYALDEHERLAFDIENLKAFPDVFVDGEDVVLTEKIHGLFLAVGAVPPAMARAEHQEEGTVFVSSKGLLGDRMAFDATENEGTNPYLRAVQQNGLGKVARILAERSGATTWLMGEVFGAGLQDLAYGAHSQTPGFRAFAVAQRDAHGVVGYLDDAALDAALAEFGLARAPVLYRGPFSAVTVAQYTSGKESLTGTAAHLREGVVITPVRERTHPTLGRVVLKSVSEAYLLRKGGTEYS